MNKRRIYDFLLFSFLFLVMSLLLVSSFSQFSSLNLSPAVSSNGVEKNSIVCISTNAWNEETNSYEGAKLIECKHNVFYLSGRNMTRDALLGLMNATFLNISLNNVTGNATAAGMGGNPVADGSEVFITRTGCGLASVMGTGRVVPTSAGNWSITTTFTSTCDNVLTNATRITNVTGGNGTTGNGLFAGVSFSVVNLSNNDQLIINWTNSVN